MMASNDEMNVVVVSDIKFSQCTQKGTQNGECGQCTCTLNTQPHNINCSCAPTTIYKVTIYEIV